MNMSMQEIQEILSRCGYYDGQQDGLWSLATELALRQFQKESGLLSLGQLDDKTVEKLTRIKESMNVN